jgi:hypothetical protein
MPPLELKIAERESGCAPSALDLHSQKGFSNFHDFSLSKLRRFSRRKIALMIDRHLNVLNKGLSDRKH